MNTTDSLILNTIQATTPLIRRIARRAPSLANQAERALHSVALQYAEREHARGGNRDAKLHGAYAEAKEAQMAIRVAVAAGVIPERAAEAALDRIDHVAAGLFLKRTRPH